ncbi:MAG: YbaK/EbsC family protein, partial [Pseudomonas alloputida]
IMAVLPANRHLDMDKVRMSGAWHLTRESGLPSLFNDCERGAVPALGDAYQIKMLLDPSLTRQGDVYLEAGDHDHLIHMSMEQYMKLVPHAEVCELC